MDFLDLIKILTNSDSLGSLIVVTILFFYINVIKPEREELQNYRKESHDKIKNILSREELENLIKNILEEKDEKKIEYFSKIIEKNVDELLRNIEGENKKIFESYQINIDGLIESIVILSHQLNSQLEKIENGVEELNSKFIKFYRLIDNIISQLESHKIIEKIEREDLKNNISKEEFDNLSLMLKKILDKQNQSGTKLKKIFNKES